MEFLSKRAKGIVPYTAGEQLNDKRYVKLNTNENPYPPSPEAEHVLRSFDAARLRLYPAPNADGLRETLARIEGVSPENIFCGNGSDEVLALCFPAFFDTDGAGACFADVTYSFYEVFARFFGVPFLTVPLKEKFYLDLSAMKEAKCGGYFIANPNAPTGVGIALEDAEAFIESVPDKIVIMDEAYMDFFGQSCAPLTKKYPNLLVVKTFSKSYSLAGMRCGYAVGNQSLISGLFRMKDCFNSYPVDALCQAVCTAAAEDRDYHEKTVELVVKERERLRGELLALGFVVPESKANFLFASHPSRGGGEIYSRLKDEGVLVRHWEKPFLRDFCRITVGTPEQDDILVQKLKKILS